jgi:hypothetical protein
VRRLGAAAPDMKRLHDLRTAVCGSAKPMETEAVTREENILYLLCQLWTRWSRSTS